MENKTSTRCVCGQLLFRNSEENIEIKCNNCKQIKKINKDLLNKDEDLKLKS